MKKLTFIFGFSMILLCYGCDSETKWSPEPIIPGHVSEPDTAVAIPGEPLTEHIRPVLTAGKRWVKRSQEMRGGEYSEPYTMIVGEDTVIGNITAKKILRIERDGTTTTDRIAWETDSKVYKLCTIYDDNIYFDYDYVCWATPDVVFGDGWVTFQPVTRGIITLQGKQRRCTEIITIAPHSPGRDGDVDYWVEGIGPLFGYTQMFSNTPFPAGGAARSEDPDYPSDYRFQTWPYVSQLLECYEGDEKIYDYREFSPELYVPQDSIGSPDWDTFTDYRIYPFRDI